ncbi:MAG: dephospho-CoA kinase [Halieaceae bacterium]|jgi:dephospho-CoA kinase|nr:dephospho-CoA kinase [Halieaceae bacterium]
MTPTLRVGVTGGIGSGKTALTDRLNAHGIVIVDADRAARDIVEPGTTALAAIVEHFGKQVLLPDGSLDRAALRKIVFEDPQERRWLEALTHPLIGERIAEQLAAAASPYVVLASPLLLEGSQHEFVDHVVVVDVPEAMQIERAIARDQNSRDLIERIMEAQLPRAERLARADTVIDNSGSLSDLDRRTHELHEQLLALSRRSPQAS